MATIVDPFIGDPDAYTNNCIEDTFFPHEMVFMFSKKGVGNRKLNLLNEKHIAIARDLLNTGYQKADFPVSHPSKKYWDETDLRAIDMKWDTVIRRYVRMRGSSLLNPAITLHAIARNGFGNAKLRYFAAVSIEAPRYRQFIRCYFAELQEPNSYRDQKCKSNHGRSLAPAYQIPLSPP